MSLIIVETLVDQPLTDEILSDTRTLDCLAERDAQWRYSLLSNDRCRMVCTFEAPDVECVRESYRKAGTHFTRIWAAQLFDAEATLTANESILKVSEATLPDGLTDEQWSTAQQAISLCYRERGVEWIRSYLSLDKVRMICELTAPDTEMIQAAQHKSGIAFDRVWAAQLLKP